MQDRFNPDIDTGYDSEAQRRFERLEDVPDQGVLMPSWLVAGWIIQKRLMFLRDKLVNQSEQDRYSVRYDHSCLHSFVTNATKTDFRTGQYNKIYAFVNP